MKGSLLRLFVQGYWSTKRNDCDLITKYIWKRCQFFHLVENSKTDYIYLVTMSNIPTSYYFQHHSCSLVDLFYPVCRLSFKFRGFRVTLVAMLNNYSCSVPHTYLWFLFCKQFTEICDSD